MSYTPTTWAKGDVITAVKLNKLEQGIANGGGGGLVVMLTPGNNRLTFDKTFGEIWTAFTNGTPVMLKYPSNALSGAAETIYGVSPVISCGWDQTNGEADYFNGYTYVLCVDLAVADDERLENWYTAFGYSATDYPVIYY